MTKPYVPFDTWARRAREEGYRARSVYKLKELDERHHLVRTGDRILDLGAAPGSWLQYLVKRTHGRGSIVGLDRVPVAPIDAQNLRMATCDITDLAAVDQALLALDAGPFDVILSDLAPNTSGIADIDQWKSIELSRTVLDIAQRYLTGSGTCVLKVLRGCDFDAFLGEFRGQFQRTKIFSPRASRDRSREVYLVGWR